jgi:hypothetical protein
MSSDSDRIAYLAGEEVASLSVEDRAELDELRSLLGETSIWDEPDPSLEDRVVAAIATAAAGAETGPGPVRGAAAETARVARSGRAARGRPAFWLRRPRLALGGLAAAAVVAIVVGVVVTRSSPTPLHFAMVVSGSSLAPRAHGSAELTKTASGWRIELSATGLPHLAGSHYYQAWLKNAAGVLVPVGTFNDAVRVTLWSGVPVTTFRSLTVTVQQLGGNPASSGRRVLTGTIR